MESIIMDHKKLIILNLTAIIEEINRIQSTGTEFTVKKDLNDLIQIAERNLERSIYILEHPNKDFK